MSKIQSPLLGYNNNVRHKNRVFHIQTEDSGIKKPHIITHLFMDGGRILKSVKTSYAEHLGADGMSDIVRGMMKDQHKAMFIALRDGQFDHLVEGAGGPASGAAKVAAPAAPPSSSALPESAPSSPGFVRRATSPGLDATSAPTSAPSTSAPSGMSPMPPPAAARSNPRNTAAFSATIPAPPPSHPTLDAPIESSRKPLLTIPDEPPQTMRDSVPAPGEGSEPSLTLDIDALERAAAESHRFKSTENDLPPPPATLFKKPDTGRYAALPRREEDTAAPVRHQSPAPPRPATGRPGSVRPPPAAARPSPSPSPPRPASVAPKKKSSRPPAAPRIDRREEAAQRYAPARPAAIFGQARPQQGSSIFGEDLISDKSLDEVILSYLAEDLETDGGKK
jgi:hypothetical protein